MTFFYEHRIYAIFILNFFVYVRYATHGSDVTNFFGDFNGHNFNKNMSDIMMDFNVNFANTGKKLYILFYIV